MKDSNPQPHLQESKALTNKPTTSFFEEVPKLEYGWLFASPCQYIGDQCVRLQYVHRYSDVAPQCVLFVHGTLDFVHVGSY